MGEIFSEAVPVGAVLVAGAVAAVLPHRGHRELQQTINNRSENRGEMESRWGWCLLMMMINHSRMRERRSLFAVPSCHPLFPATFNLYESREFNLELTLAHTVTLHDTRHH